MINYNWHGSISPLNETKNIDIVVCSDLQTLFELCTSSGVLAVLYCQCTLYTNPCTQLNL